MRTIKLTVQYNGAGYRGWQSQKQGEATVQDTLGDAIKKLTGEDVSVIGSGRTDSGVHALGQVAVFQTECEHSIETIQRALNVHLPDDIGVVSVEVVHDDFHPVRDAKVKRYAYMIANMPSVSPFMKGYAWHVPQELDVEAMARAGELMRGVHDFKCFLAAGSDVKTTVREIYSLEIERLSSIGFAGMELEGNFIRIEVAGGGFLRHMVRNIAGTLVDVGRGKTSLEGVGDIIALKDRAQAGPTAPAHGLFMLDVEY